MALSIKVQEGRIEESAPAPDELYPHIVFNYDSTACLVLSNRQDSNIAVQHQ